MTAALGVNKTKYDAGASGDNYIPAGEYIAPVCAIMDSYEASALADASTIAVANLPAGAKIVDIILMTDDLGSTVTLSVGDSASAGRYVAATSVTNAGRVSINLVDGMQYEIGTASGDNVILLTGAGILTGTIKVTVLFTYA